MYRLQRKKKLSTLSVQCVEENNKSAACSPTPKCNMIQFSFTFDTTVKFDAKMLGFMHKTQGGSLTLY